MKIDLTGHDDLAIRYICDWWDLHPEWLASLDRVDDLGEIHGLRNELFDKVNAATDGHLETIVPRHGIEWVYLVGAAVATTMKERRRGA